MHNVTQPDPTSRKKEKMFPAGNFLSLSLFAVLTLLWTALPMTLAAQNKSLNPATIEMVKSMIKNAAQKTATITSDFVQEKEMSMVREKITSKGRFYFKKERMLRWEYVQPYSYLIIIRNDQVTIKDESKVSSFNAGSNKIFREINRIMQGCINGTLLSDEKNFLASFAENSACWVITLKPLAPRLKASISQIVIFFNRKDYSVNRLEIYEPGGDCTKINFMDKKLNQPVDDEMFLVH